MYSYFKQIKTSILFYTLVYLGLYLLVYFILSLFNLTYILWFKQATIVLVSIGFIASTIQIGIQNTKKITISSIILIICEVILSILIYFGFMILHDPEEVVYTDGRQQMVQVTHSVLVSNWIKYYDYENFFVRGKQERIYKAYNNTLQEYMYTIYYDKDGNVIKEER